MQYNNYNSMQSNMNMQNQNNIISNNMQFNNCYNNLNYGMNNMNIMITNQNGFLSNNPINDNQMNSNMVNNYNMSNACMNNGMNNYCMNNDMNNICMNNGISYNYMNNYMNNACFNYNNMNNNFPNNLAMNNNFAYPNYNFGMNNMVNNLNNNPFMANLNNPMNNNNNNNFMINNNMNNMNMNNMNYIINNINPNNSMNTSIEIPTNSSNKSSNSNNSMTKRINKIINNIIKQNYKNNDINKIKENLNYYERTQDLDFLIKGCKILPQKLDSNGDSNFSSYVPRMSGPRGFTKKYTIPKGWKGYGLKVMGLYDNGNDEWIGNSNSDGEWYIAYHGTKTMGAVNGIINHGFRRGNGQSHEESNNSNPLTEIQYPKCGVGVYFTPDIVEAKKYTEPIYYNGYKFSVVIMCRINPYKVRIHGVPDDSLLDYFIVNGDELSDNSGIKRDDEVRPYRILLLREEA